jgi:hypothetical protein
MSTSAEPEPTPTYDPSNAYFTGALLQFVQHKWNCDWLQPMWHKGPCDCGLTDLIKQMPEDLLALLVSVSDHVRATVEDMKTQAAAEEKAP